MGKMMILRALWGDSTQRKQNRGLQAAVPGEPREQMLSQVLTAWRRDRVGDLVVCFGRENYDFCLDHGLPAMLASTSPWASPRLRDQQYQESRHWSLVWGMTTWWHKLRAIEMALCAFDHVLWVDWRVQLAQPQRLAGWQAVASSGEFFRGSLLRQHSSGWGARWRHTNAPQLRSVKQWPPSPGARFPLPFAHDLVGGGLLYFRGAAGLALVRLALSLLDDSPSWTDMQALSAALDVLHGEWVGLRAWRRLYELPGYYYARNRWYCDEADEVWRCGERLPKIRHRRALWS